MDIGTLGSSSNLWKTILEKIQDIDYGVFTKGNIKELSSELISEDKPIIDELNKGSSWNKSVRKLQELISGLYDGDGILDKYPGAKGGDAGASYTNGEWVKPFINIDDDSYSDVRNIDAMQSVLKSDDESQFTVGKITNYVCRLIMPKYVRRVEVEDLNRNFWVIAQVIASICDFLFNPDSDLYKILKRILDEFTQLWENVAYLWSIIPFIQKEDKVISLFYQVPIADAYTEDLMLGYKNYDNFDNFGEIEEPGSLILKHLLGENQLRYFFQAFPHTHVILMPLIRADNYRENYFAKMVMPGIIFHNFRTNLNYLFDFTYQFDVAKMNSYKYNKDLKGMIEKLKNVVYIDMIDKQIKVKKHNPLTLAEWEKFYKGERDNRPTDKFKDFDVKSLDNFSDITVDGLDYNALQIYSPMSQTTYEELFESQDDLFILRKNNGQEIKVNGTFIDTGSHRAVPDYIVGTIDLTFSDFEGGGANDIFYLGDCVSYYS